jgi:hypothetical protein
MSIAKVKLAIALALAKIVNYDRFIVQATVTTVVNYDHNTFIVQ